MGMMSLAPARWTAAAGTLPLNSAEAVFPGWLTFARPKTR